MFYPRYIHNHNQSKIIVYASEDVHLQLECLRTDLCIQNKNYSTYIDYVQQIGTSNIYYIQISKCVGIENDEDNQTMKIVRRSVKNVTENSQLKHKYAHFYLIKEKALQLIS